MKIKEIESQVRRYAYVSLALNRDKIISVQIDISELLDDAGDILPNTQLSEIGTLITRITPFAEPRWLADGLVLDPKLTLLDLAAKKHVHVNRTTDALRQQLKILMKNLYEAATYKEIDDWYVKVTSLLKNSRKRRELEPLIETLKINVVESKLESDAFQVYVTKMVTELEKKFKNS
jgi:hypothetical protein